MMVAQTPTALLHRVHRVFLIACASTLASAVFVNHSIQRDECENIAKSPVFCFVLLLPTILLYA